MGKNHKYLYILTAGINAVSNMKLHRDLGITQTTDRHLSHRIRQTWTDEHSIFEGQVKVGEVYFGGKEKNKPANKKLKAGRGPVAKTFVVGVRDRTTNNVSAQVVQRTDRRILNAFVDSHAAEETMVYTDGTSTYQGPQQPRIRDAFRRTSTYASMTKPTA